MEEGASLISTSGIPNGHIWRFWGPGGIQKVSTFEETLSRRFLGTWVVFSSLLYGDSSQTQICTPLEAGFRGRVGRLRVCV